MRPAAFLGVWLAAASAFAASLPPVPPLPEAGWPSPAQSEPFARALIREVTPAQLEALLAADREQLPPVLRNLGVALMTTNPELRKSVETYLPALAQARARRVTALMASDALQELVAFQVVDPVRYAEDPAFRARVDALLPKMLSPAIDYGVREAALHELATLFRYDYARTEALASAWRIAPRASGARRVEYAPSMHLFSHDVQGTIDATIVSLHSEFFSASEARAFLRGLRASSPKRRILVLADPRMRAELHDMNVTVIDTHARIFTPWPRDPFAVTRTKDGGVVFVNRPNQQPNREEDANMVRAIVAGLPSAIDKEWSARWSVAPFPFHNGHVLVMPDAAWISIHTVEIRALQIAGVPRVPVETFHTAAGIQKYVKAVQQAAKELETLYGRPVRFVHALPAANDPLAKQIALMQSLGGGGGFDLDSVVTLLPRKDGKLHALVGDIHRGAALARTASWTEAHRAYAFTGDAKNLGPRIADAQKTGRAPGLQAFLDVVAAHLTARGMTVERIPLLDVPYALLTDPNAISGSDFLLTWHNVVIEGGRAQGFASLVPEGDAVAREVFARAGYALDLLPPLVRSIVLNGGFRCASNHVRR